MTRFFQRDRWWAILAAVLLVLSVWAVLAVYGKVSSNEKLQNANNTEGDLYWFEQTVTGRIEVSQRQIIAMISDVQRRNTYKEQFVAYGAQIMSGTPSLTNINWLDKRGVSRGSVATMMKNTDIAPVTRSLLEEEAIKDARAKNGSAAAGPFLMSDGDYEVSFVQPLYNDSNELTGFIKSNYSLQTLFKNVVPAWFATKYHLHVYHRNETLYTTMHDGSIHFDEALPSAKRDMRLGSLSLVMRAQLYPDNQVWVLRALFAGLVFLLLTLLASLLTLMFDMRRRRATEKELIAQNNLRKAIETSLTVGIRAHSIDGTMIYVNPAFCEMIGYSASEVLNIPPPLPYIPKDEAVKLLAVRDRLLVDPLAESELEIKMRKKSGEIIDTIMRGGPMYGDDGQHIGWISSVEDVTERKRLELFQEDEQKRLETVNHLISMGEMASAIAHELNQPLSAISGYATGLSNYIQKGEQALSRERLIDVTEKIRRQAERAANVTRRVQQFAKQETIAPTALDVPNLIDQVIDFMELELRQKGCHIEKHLTSSDLPGVFMDRTMAQQILINILRNAIDAMIEYNVIDKRIDIYAEQYSTHHVMISIFDKGPGVPEDKVETIFQPFYTTKTQGIGIGLNICRTMIESNGGRLWAKADANGGIFYLTMPIHLAELKSNTH